VSELSTELVAAEEERAPRAPVSDRARFEIRTGAGVLIGFFGILFGWAALAPLDAAVVASGVIVVAGNRQTVQHRDGGVVSRLTVMEGQEVAQNDILIELAAPELVAQERALFFQVIDLQLQQARLTAESAGARAIQRPAQWSTLSAEDRALADEAFQRYAARGAAGEGGARAWSEYDARIAGYTDETVSIRRQEALLEEELVGMRSLAERGLVPLTRVRALERGVAELEGRRAELRAMIAATQQDRSEALRDVEARLREATPQYVSAREQVERTRIRAPTAGVVVGLSVHTVGGVIRGGDRLMDIVPRHQELLVEAEIRPEDADDIEPGQKAEVRITAFAGRNLPIVDGVVQRISADRFVNERTGQGYFLAQVSVPEDEIGAMAGPNGNLELRAGLPAEVIVPTRKRTALEFLLEPLNQAVWRSFREG
jgi:HlyD family secretion protein